MKFELNQKIYSLDDIDDKNFGRIVSLCAHNMMHTQFGGFDVMYSTYNNVKYIVENKIPGDIVECGVWKGGMMQLIAYTLLELGDTSRKLYLYDTFEGMSEPSELDVDWDGNSPYEQWLALKPSDGESKFSKFGYGGGVDDVKRIMEETRYPEANIRYVKGMVEETIPSVCPDEISYLRLDTDFYSSTKHELEFLYPVLVTGGVLVIDDYGYFQGARKATDDYINEHNLRILLSRVSFLGVREGIKQN